MGEVKWACFLSRLLRKYQQDDYMLCYDRDQEKDLSLTATRSCPNIAVWVILLIYPACSSSECAGTVLRIRLLGSILQPGEKVVAVLVLLQPCEGHLCTGNIPVVFVYAASSDIGERASP